MESNAFNSVRPEADTRSGPLGVLAGAVGLLAVVVTFAIDPFGRSVFIASWTLLLGGVALALLPGPARPVGKGLAFAGVAVPGAAFAFLWVVVSFAALTGSIG